MIAILHKYFSSNFKTNFRKPQITTYQGQEVRSVDKNSIPSKSSSTSSQGGKTTRNSFLKWSSILSSVLVGSTGLASCSAVDGFGTGRYVSGYGSSNEVNINISPNSTCLEGINQAASAGMINQKDANKLRAISFSEANTWLDVGPVAEAAVNGRPTEEARPLGCFQIMFDEHLYPIDIGWDQFLNNPALQIKIALGLISTLPCADEDMQCVGSKWLGPSHRLVGGRLVENVDTNQKTPYQHGKNISENYAQLNGSTSQSLPQNTSQSGQPTYNNEPPPAVENKRNNCIAADGIFGFIDTKLRGCKDPNSQYNPPSTESYPAPPPAEPTYAPPSQPVSEAPGYCAVNVPPESAGLNVRRQANSSSPIMLTVGNGQNLPTTGEINNGWRQVLVIPQGGFQKEPGWVFSNYCHVN